jgi:hypothetical protein
MLAYVRAVRAGVMPSKTPPVDLAVLGFGAGVASRLVPSPVDGGDALANGARWGGLAADGQPAVGVWPQAQCDLFAAPPRRGNVSCVPYNASWSPAAGAPGHALRLGVGGPATGVFSSLTAWAEGGSPLNAMNDYDESPVGLYTRLSPALGWLRSAAPGLAVAAAAPARCVASRQ